MRGLIQRVTEAKVKTNNNEISSIKNGLLILLGIEHSDSKEDAEWLAQKVLALRIFDDEKGVMNKSLMDIKGETMVVSQFTLHARTKKGNRPSYVDAAQPNHAIPLYEYFVQQLENFSGKKVATGIFGADMQVELVNDGPVTIFIDTKNKI